MIYSENICDVEIACDELPVVLHRVKEVGKICVLALLLEWSSCFEVILFMVDLLSSALVKSIQGQAIHEGSIHLASAVWILKVRIFAHFTVVACIIVLTSTNLTSLVELTKSIAF